LLRPSEQDFRGGLQGGSDLFDVVDRQVAFATFHRTYERPMHASEVGKRLLTQVKFTPPTTNVLSKDESKPVLAHSQNVEL
jgi:hypothetical protein